jgi:hypothetical protein
MPKFLGVASKRGFLVVLVCLVVAKGAGAGFLDDLAFGGYSAKVPKSKSQSKSYGIDECGHGDESVSIQSNHRKRREQLDPEL